ncbi:GIY-YIG nuclease family protein [Parapedobacter sp. 10938]|uniref:GIY-YIG nuclease family protein n=1 Tax=Parapedobacter flavus TaxID=3110225 RepID=UPI002DBDEEEC|nr:GIY-YIG nuclease family protein [Parapedobacter sp. 10938]MEC3881701.1 GIY-YIG nuclease family protein [Parapedobacter sp. 10938]
MNNYIYILTDSNRNCLHVGMTDDLQKAAKTYRELNGLFFEAISNVSRLVYHEAFTNEEEALLRFKELSRYTRMQKERLIRRRNPNWLALGIPAAMASINPSSLSHRGVRPAFTNRAQN